MDIHTTAYVCIAAGVLCFFVILTDVALHPQQMKVMNIVWPVTALYSGPIGVAAYYIIGRETGEHAAMNIQDTGKKHHHHAMHQQQPVTTSAIIKSSLHCGAGCTAGDMLAAVFLTLVPIAILGNSLYNSWLVEFAFAFIAGIIFQYYAVKPMKNLPPGKALVTALKADTLSLISWQAGMYGWMAVCTFIIFHTQLEPDDPVYWCMMQVGMLAGLITAYPINYLLLKKGIKEAM